MNEIEVTFKGVNQRFLLSQENNFGNINIKNFNGEMQSNSDEKVSISADIMTGQIVSNNHSSIMGN